MEQPPSATSLTHLWLPWLVVSWCLFTPQKPAALGQCTSLALLSFGRRTASIFVVQLFVVTRLSGTFVVCLVSSGIVIRPGSIRRNRRWHRNCTPVQCFVNSKHFCQQMRHKRHPHTRCLPLLDRRTGSVHTSHLCQQFCRTSFCERQAFVSSITSASHDALLHLLFFFFSS